MKINKLFKNENLIHINNHDSYSLLNLNHNSSTIKKLHFIILTSLFIINLNELYPNSLFQYLIIIEAESTCHYLK